MSMRLSVAPKDLRSARHEILSQVQKLGMNLDNTKASDINLAVGEVIGNIYDHSGFQNANVGVARKGDNLLIKVSSGCYCDPDVTKSWFDPDRDVPLTAERGRGGGITRFLTKDIRCLRGAVCLIFNI